MLDLIVFPGRLTRWPPDQFECTGSFAMTKPREPTWNDLKAELVEFDRAAARALTMSYVGRFDLERDQ